ncbi:MAG: hypothetical protein AABZ60_10390 [Planctomycetota bacterium]
MQELRRLFGINTALPSIKLEKFLDETTFLALRKSLGTLEWVRKEKPMEYSFSIADSNAHHFNKKEMLDFIGNVIGKKIKKIEGAWHCFSWKDYTLLHDEKIEKPGFDIILDMTAPWPLDAGGVVTYSDGAGATNKLPIQENALVIIQRKEGVQKFVQYVNNHGKERERVLFLGTIRL